MTDVQFEVFDELPDGVPERRSKYHDFWMTVRDNPGRWVKWPYDAKTNVNTLAHKKGFQTARRNGDAFVRQEVTQ